MCVSSEGSDETALGQACLNLHCLHMMKVVQRTVLYQNLVSTVKPVLSGHSKKDQNLTFKTDYRLMQV